MSNLVPDALATVIEIVVENTPQQVLGAGCVAISMTTREPASIRYHIPMLRGDRQRRSVETGLQRYSLVLRSDYPKHFLSGDVGKIIYSDQKEAY